MGGLNEWSTVAEHFQKWSMTRVKEGTSTTLSCKFHQLATTPDRVRW